MSALHAMQAFVTHHPWISLAILLAAIVTAAGFWPEKGPFDGDDDNPSGGNWP